jgi:hypothetical protein
MFGYLLPAPLTAFAGRHPMPRRSGAFGGLAKSGWPVMSLCRHLASALALLVSYAVAVAEERKIDDGQGLAEPAPRAVEQTDRIVACAAGLLDLDAFKRLLTEGEREQLAIERKLRRGQYERVAPLDSKIARTSAAGLIRRIQENLAALDGSERTAALLYDLQKDETTATTFLCSWLVTSHHVRLYRGEFLWPSLTAFVQHGLRVTARAAARAPVRLGQPPAARQEAVPATTSDHVGEVLAEAADVLLAPAIRNEIIEAGIDRLLILAEGDVSTIPFAALPVSEGRTLIDVASVVILPDVELLLSPHPLSPRAFDGAKLIVGDPQFPPDKAWRMPDLPGAKAEAAEVARLFGASALLGKDATRGAVMTRLAARSIDLAYFATHGVADEVDPMDGGFLALADQHLYGRDIKRLKLPSGPLVVMSACQTGLGKVFQGGVFGLARAWYFAGASQVVMSLWNLDDDATKTLMLSSCKESSIRFRLSAPCNKRCVKPRPNFPIPLYGPASPSTDNQRVSKAGELFGISQRRSPD